VLQKLLREDVSEEGERLREDEREDAEEDELQD
jgi:hypothetical protein